MAKCRQTGISNAKRLLSWHSRMRGNISSSVQHVRDGLVIIVGICISRGICNEDASRFIPCSQYNQLTSTGKFCKHCGTLLTRACPKCNSVLDNGTKNFVQNVVLS